MILLSLVEVFRSSPSVPDRWLQQIVTLASITINVATSMVPDSHAQAVAQLWLRSSRWPRGFLQHSVRHSEKVKGRSPTFKFILVIVIDIVRGWDVSSNRWINDKDWQRTRQMSGMAQLALWPLPPPPKEPNNPTLHNFFLMQITCRNFGASNQQSLG